MADLPIRSDALQGLLERLCEVLEVPACRAVVLLGSAARDEATWRVGPRGFELFSDLEFLVVLDQPLRVDVRHGALESVRRIEAELATVDNPLFHVDVTFVRYRHLPNLPTRAWTHDLRRVGRVLSGDGNVLSKVPVVTEKNLDLAELHCVLLWRALAIAAHAPMARLTQGCWPEWFQYVVAKNTLDVLTWLLPTQGVLLSSFSSRLEWLEQHWADVRREDLLPSGFLRILRECLDVKLHLKWVADPAASLDAALAGLQWVTRRGIGLGGGGGRFLAAGRRLGDLDPVNLARDVLHILQRPTDWVRSGGGRAGVLPRVSLLSDSLRILERITNEVSRGGASAPRGADGPGDRSVLDDQTRLVQLASCYFPFIRNQGAYWTRIRRAGD